MANSQKLTAVSKKFFDILEENTIEKKRGIA
jgi:hypothetical protein